MPCQARQQPVLVRNFRRFVPSIVALLELIHCPHQSWKLGKAGGLLGSWLGAALVLWSSVCVLLGLVSHRVAQVGHLFLANGKPKSAFEERPL